MLKKLSPSTIRQVSLPQSPSNSESLGSSSSPSVRRNNTSLASSASVSSFGTQASRVSVGSSRWSLLKGHAKGVKTLLSRRTSKSASPCSNEDKAPRVSVKVIATDKGRMEEENPFLSTSDMKPSGSVTPKAWVSSLRGQKLLRTLKGTRLNPFPKKKRMQHDRRHSTDDSMVSYSDFADVFSQRPSLDSSVTTSTQDTPELITSNSASAISYITDSDLSEEDYWLQLSEQKEYCDLEAAQKPITTAGSVSAGCNSTANLCDAKDITELLEMSPSVSLKHLIDTASVVDTEPVLTDEIPPWSIESQTSLSSFYALSQLMTPSSKIIKLLVEARHENQSLMETPSYWFD
jgi:hypothetical protein